MTRERNDSLPLAQFLARRRRQLGLSQLTIAVRCGLSEVTIRFLESGRNRDPRLTTAFRLARGYEASLAELAACACGDEP